MPNSTMRTYIPLCKRRVTATLPPLATFFAASVDNTMMKLAAVLSLASLLHQASAKAVEIPMNAAIDASSDTGLKLLSQARRLDDQADYTWVAGYSLKFQGCHQIRQWNDNADEEEDVRIKTTRLVRFRLCPNSSCSSSGSAGCRSGYGDYVVDLETYVNAYYEVSRKNTEYACQMHLNYNCDCQDDSSKGDDFNAEYCEYDCFNDSRMYQCIDRDPYQDESQQQEQQEEFQVEQYMACGQLDIQDDGSGRKLEDGSQEDQYYVGPYCADQGGKILLGLFTDDTCSTFADSNSGRSTYKELMGETMPYSKTSIVGSECVKCVEQEFNDNTGDATDQDAVAESCEEIYIAAGKCEGNLPDGMIASGKNEAGCKFMEGIKIVREDGIIMGSARPSPVMTAFIVIFAMSFAALGFYVWYLRTRLGTKQNTLL